MAMTLEQADREHLRLYRAFCALANAAADAHPCIANPDKRAKFGNAVNEAWRAIEITAPLLSPAATPAAQPTVSAVPRQHGETRDSAVETGARGKDL